MILRRPCTALAAVATLLALPACARGQAVSRAIDSTVVTELPPGLGQLNQDVITLRLRTGTLEVRFLPLEERLIRLLAPDAYQALHQMLRSYRVRIDSIASSRGVHDPGVALVSFHALAPDTRFDPAILTLSLRGQQYRPIGTIPLSPSFSNQQLDVRAQASGLFVYERQLPVQEPFSLRYLDGTNEEWERRLQRLDTERARILGRSRHATDSLTP
ncbi:MAG: hypothetical protein ABJC19_06400 [Gemmatimonadota bacterium]